MTAPLDPPADAIDIGTEGTVASVRRINRGASIVIHLTGPAAERALRLELRDVVRLVKAPPCA